MTRQSYLLRFYLTTKQRDITSEKNSDATTQVEKTQDELDICCYSSDTSATYAVEITATDVIYVGSSTISANASSERVSLLYTS